MALDIKALRASNASTSSSPINKAPTGKPNFLSHLLNIADIRYTTLKFLTPKDLAAIEATSRSVRCIAPLCWEDQQHIEGLIPEAVPEGMSLGQIFKDLYPNAFGPQFYKSYLGDVGPVPPIPRHFVEAANHPDPFPASRPAPKIKDIFELVLIPASVTITVDHASRLTLDDNGRLIEIEGPMLESPIGAKREIRVPITLRNIEMLTKKCLREGTPIGFHNGFNDFYWEPFFEQHGDTPVESSHWSYQRKEALDLLDEFGRGENIKDLLAGAGLEIMPLLDTVIRYLLEKVKGNPDSFLTARTSTPTVDGDGIERPIAVYWMQRAEFAPANRQQGIRIPPGLVPTTQESSELDIMTGFAVGISANSPNSETH